MPNIEQHHTTIVRNAEEGHYEFSFSGLPLFKCSGMQLGLIFEAIQEYPNIGAAIDALKVSPKVSLSECRKLETK